MTEIKKGSLDVDVPEVPQVSQESEGEAVDPLVVEVTADDVLRVAKEYLDPAEMVIVIAGDYGAIRDGLDGLGMGSVILLTDSRELDSPPQS